MTDHRRNQLAYICADLLNVPQPIRTYAIDTAILALQVYENLDPPHVRAGEHNTITRARVKFCQICKHEQ
jgi:hypothetical protein